MKVSTPKSAKKRKAIVTILIAIGSFLAGLVSTKNEELGKLLDTVVKVAAPVIVSDSTPTDSISFNQ